MEKYYKKYYILNSYSDRCKSITIKALDNNDGYINIFVTFNGKDVRQNLILVGFDKQGYVVFKKDLKDSITVDKNDFICAYNLAIILEKDNTCSLEYLQMQYQTDIIKFFEMYRFKNFSNKKNDDIKKNNNEELSREKNNDEQISENANQNNDNIDKHQKQSFDNQAQGLSDMMKTFSKATSILDSFNNMSFKKNTQKDDDIKSPSKDVVNPFTNTFPNSEWIKTEFHGNSGYWHYLSGKVFEGENLIYKAIAVPGEYSMTPPAWLDGLSKYYVCDSPFASGYWIMFTDPHSGNIVNGPN